jgi:adenylate cyclase
MKNKSAIDSKLEESFWSLTSKEFLINSAHFPLVNLILESILAGPQNYFYKFDPYILLLSALVQSIGLTFLLLKNAKYSFLGNLIGPMIYFLFETFLEGADFFKAPQHQAYWYFSMLITLLQFLKYKIESANRLNVIEVCENVVRTLIPLCMYMLFELGEKDFLKSFPVFFEDPAHVFLSIVIFLLGILIGFSEAQKTLVNEKLKKLANQLKIYSSWSLGNQVLNQAVQSEDIFKIKRVNRAILFLDIRGFTKWSEKQTPETVVEMLNEYYLEAEDILKETTILKVKYTADEIMLVFENSHVAARSALLLTKSLNVMLNKFNLSAGGGLHLGPVVEGLIGSHHSKIFDVMGDTVNTAKRLCESAKGSELLVSKEIIESSEGRAVVIHQREVVLKGKENTHTVYCLDNYLAS